ncbi:hypothetical protein [Georgenia alba]|uniref:Uncharacterized protein n=1 Tax=Georgenia alba TaxID=2233858 RepID=A0ABW2Q9A3_9MICO
MILGRRSSRLPRTIRALLPGSPYATAELADGRWAVVTGAELLVASEEGVTQRHPWHTVERGRWDGETRTVTVTWVDGSRSPLELRTASDEVASFAAALRERVQASVVHSDAAETATGAQIKVYIRRDETGALLSQVTVTGTLRGDGEETRVVDEVERRARAAVGLPT